MGEAQATGRHGQASERCEALLAEARATDPDGLRQLARGYDWSECPETVLTWVMAQKCIDLGTALSAFFNGGPERFNYIPKRDVPAKFRGTVQVLDNICLRVNSGFFLVWPDCGMRGRDRLARWLAYQGADRQEGRQGRWILDERILEPLLKDALRLDPARETAIYHKDSSLLRDLFSPVMELGVSRRLLHFLPSENDPAPDPAPPRKP